MSRAITVVLLLVAASAIAVAATLTKPTAPTSSTTSVTPAAPATTASPAKPAATTVAERPVLYDKSEIRFTVAQMNVPVTGQFRRFTAHVNLDAAKPETSSANVEVDIASITMGDEDADAAAVDKPWLNAAGFPKASFRSSSIRALAAGRYEVKGTLVIKGKPRELTVPISMQDQPGGSSLVSGEFSVRRTDFDIGGGEWNQADVVANEVPVRFKIVLGPAR